MRADGVCASCGARVRWAMLDGTARLIPLDVEARDDGNIGVVEWGPRVKGLPRPVVKVNPTAAITRYRYATHFATCPNAADHRRADRITGGHR